MHGTHNLKLTHCNMMHGTHNVTLTHCNMMHGTHNVKLTHCNMMHGTYNVKIQIGFLSPLMSSFVVPSVNLSVEIIQHLTITFSFRQ